LGRIALGLDHKTGANTNAPAAALPPKLLRLYEDHVLGKLYADRSFERASDALRRFAGRDRARGVAYVVHQFQQRAGFSGAHISPATVKALLELPPGDVMARGWESLDAEGIDERLLT